MNYDYRGVADCNRKQLSKIYLFGYGDEDAKALRDTLSVGLAKKKKKVEVYVTGKGKSYYMQVYITPLNVERKYQPKYYTDKEVIFSDAFFNTCVRTKKSQMYNSLVMFDEKYKYFQYTNTPSVWMFCMSCKHYAKL